MKDLTKVKFEIDDHLLDKLSQKPKTLEELDYQYDDEDNKYVSVGATDKNVRFMKNKVRLTNLYINGITDLDLNIDELIAITNKAIELFEKE